MKYDYIFAVLATLQLDKITKFYLNNRFKQEIFDIFFLNICLLHKKKLRFQYYH